MADKHLFLRSMVTFEPPVDRSVARPHTMVPVRAAMNAVERDRLTS